MQQVSLIAKFINKGKLWFGVWLALFSIVAPTAVLAAPPADFQTSLVVGAGLDGPSGFEIAPDGRIFILERTGKIKIYKNGQLLATPFANLPSAASGDRGLIGIAFDPDYGVHNNHVYFYYTGLDLLNHIVRFDASGDVGAQGPFQIFQTNSPSQELHVGGSIRFGADGKLYFAVGDNGYPPNAQDLSNPHGKILRINKDGTTPTDNPFYGQPGVLDAIWAYGMRNPWRFQFDSQTGNMYGGDVGNYSWEEVNHIVRGGNYGWPLQEGMCTENCASYINPIHAYPHDGDSAAVTGGPIYRGSAFPAAYQGNLFFGDYAKGFIKRAVLDASGNATAVHNFDTAAGSVVDLKVGPDGSLYYITYYPGRLYKVTYNTDNHAPTAVAGSNVTNGVAPLAVSFNSTGTVDPDGDSLTYHWDFGDGTTSASANPTKTYSTNGVYTAQLKVSDGVFESQATPIVVQVGLPPQVNISVPSEGYQYTAGETITYNAFATDSAGFDINDANIKAEVLLHHGTHYHPYAGPFTGRTGSFKILTTGEASADTWFEIKVTATADNGLSTTTSRNIYPKKSKLTFATQPAGLQLQLDGVPISTPTTVEGVEGFQREIAAPAVAYSATGTPYHFTGWSDGGAIRHFITTPVADTTYKATYATSPPFKGEYFNNKDLTGTPVLTRQDKKVDFIWGEDAPAPGINADNFSVRWTKTQAFAAGRYKFTTASDDGVRLYIDGALAIDAWRNQSDTAYTYTVDLSAGNHSIRMEYFDATVYAVARLTIEAVADQPTPFAAEYWNVPGAPVIPTTAPNLKRADPAINFNWGAGSPGAGINANKFVARWTKTIAFSPGNYTFTVKADDGVRLYIDGVRVIDKWIDQGATTYTSQQMLSPGYHTVVMEYFENGGDALAHFSYVKNSNFPAPAKYKAEFWNMPAPNDAPVFPTRTADATRQDAIIDYYWGEATPHTGITADHFAGRWSKTETLPSGIYRFNGFADDGVRIYLDGELVLNKWQSQNEAYSVDKVVQSGVHTIKIEYYEGAGDAGLAFAYNRIANVPTTPTPPPPPSSDFTAEYFSNPDLAGTPVLTRTETAINYNWGLGSPAPSVPVDSFSARWSKKAQTFAAGTYRFAVTGDDGVRVFVDGQLVINGWVDQGATLYTADVSLTAGPHSVTVEYYESGGDALAQFAITQL